METVTATSSPTITFPSSNLSSTNILKKYSKSTVTLISRKGINRPIKTTAISDVSASANPAEAEVTWQIIVGAIAGITPFVVAGIEFSKRIMAQRRCEVCGGSGLVLRDKKYYFRCPRCGGFLPWQSWKRFFSG
ncbi:uncharacterized protein LOC119990145 [Tripterygium wilfordii]|uniref:uncharacterized protein LOC119990145 n=1 Tax=Tripterygium wilfordii TaxID=458696 RepID=UPI0018F7F1D5|nr:uncharacterized protein LOC119990145 [Tripterygium wilfordii]